MVPHGSIRILLVDDQPLFRRAIATLISKQPDFDVIGEADNGLEAVEKTHELNPDLVVMDVEMPVMSGVEAVRLIRDQMPAVKVVMLTVSESDEYLFDAIKYGAHGYLLKDLRPEQLYDMLRAVMRNETPLSPAIACKLLAEFRASGRGGGSAGAGAGFGGPVRQAPAAEPEGPALTRREIEVLQLVSDGLSNKEIGTRLSITEGTVKNHVHNALEAPAREPDPAAACGSARMGTDPHGGGGRRRRPRRRGLPPADGAPLDQARPAHRRRPAKGPVSAQARFPPSRPGPRPADPVSAQPARSPPGPDRRKGPISAAHAWGECYVRSEPRLPGSKLDRGGFEPPETRFRAWSTLGRATRTRSRARPSRLPTRARRDWQEPQARHRFKRRSTQPAPQLDATNGERRRECRCVLVDSSTRGSVLCDHEEPRDRVRPPPSVAHDCAAEPLLAVDAVDR
jgi:DNA-binding NarL/FixJ family response regulator